MDSTPRPAATVVLMRQSERGLEVLVTVRPKELRFMGGATVFPGGATADADCDLSWEAASMLDGAAAGAALALEPGPALGAYVCALREAFEEVGYLAGAGPIDELQRSDADAADRFLHRCLELGVVLATDQLVPAGRWVTPLGAPVRFDTQFFVTRAPDGWEPVPDPSEVAECRWVTPTEELVEFASGRAIMAPPTVEMLQRLEGHATVDDAIESLRDVKLDERPGLFTARLSPLVHLVLAPNPGVMTGPGTNTYIVGSGTTCVIDPAIDEPRFIDCVCELGGEISTILVTHRHLDHVGGIATLAACTRAVVRAFGDQQAGGIDVVPLKDGEVVEVGAARLTAIHTPGHSSDHLCFLLEGAASLFSGDTVLGEGTAVIAPPDGDMADYLASLRRLAEFHIDRIYPGHWRPLDGGRKVFEDYIEHRLQREGAIIDAIDQAGSTLDEIVERAYADTPKELHPIARYSATAHLEMLAKQGRVTHSDDRWKLEDVN